MNKLGNQTIMLSFCCFAAQVYLLLLKSFRCAMIFFRT